MTLLKPLGQTEQGNVQIDIVTFNVCFKRDLHAVQNDNILSYLIVKSRAKMAGKLSRRFGVGVHYWSDFTNQTADEVHRVKKRTSIFLE